MNEKSLKELLSKLIADGNLGITLRTGESLVVHTAKGRKWLNEVLRTHEEAVALLRQLTGSRGVREFRDNGVTRFMVPFDGGVRLVGAARLEKDDIHIEIRRMVGKDNAKNASTTLEQGDGEARVRQSDTDAAMTFKYNFAKEDLLAWFHHSINSSPAARHRRVRYITTWCIIYFSVAVIVSAYLQAWLVVVCGLCLAGLLSYLTSLSYDKQIEQALERQVADPQLHESFGDYQLILTEAGLREITPATDSLVKWQAVTDVIAEGKHIFIRLATGQAAVINRQTYSGPVDFESIPAVIQEFKTKNTS